MSESPHVKVLATDMDGTLIPLEGNEQNRSDLRDLESELKRNNIALMYVTGRHLELVLDAVRTHALPSPPWMICDVGATIYKSNRDGRYVSLDAYAQHLNGLVGEYGRDELMRSISQIDGLRAQEEEKQSRFKISYYCEAGQQDEVVAGIGRRLIETNAPYRMIDSIDPFTGEGLIDLLPIGVSKAYALQWWATHTQSDRHSIIFAGDSGNDIAALTAGYRSIVVGNAERSVMVTVARAHNRQGWTNRLAIVDAFATSGVLEGLRRFVASSKQSTS